MNERILKTIIAIINENNDLLNDKEFAVLKQYLEKRNGNIIRKEFNQKEREQIEKIFNQIDMYLPLISSLLPKKIDIDRETCDLINKISLLKFLKRVVSCGGK